MRSFLLFASFAALSLGGATTSSAQEITLVREAPAVQGRAVELIIRSEIMGRDYRIEVTPPHRGPVFPGQKASVVYALDGGWGVAGPAGVLLGGGGAMSPAYIVAVGYPVGQRNSREADLLPRPVVRRDGSTAQGGRSELFTRFLIEELKPFIEARYPVDPQRSILFGHSLGGIFTAHVLADQPSAFAGYLIASPSVWADPTIPERLRTASAGQDRLVFVAYGEREDDYMVEGGRAVSAALESRGDHVRTEVFPGAYHITYYPAVMGAALPFLLPRQAPLEFPTAIELPASTLAGFAGRYLIGGAVPVDLAVAGKGIVATVPGGGRLELSPRSSTGFFSPDLDVRADFGDGGRTMTLYVNGDRIDAARLP
ncbi:alpha/beta hydrolase [Brevundimonas sp.]|uniref:alpha/beta hydrolase n=1 Tax=Brevundimonas sp. TaxID=1871086 RepID=UPI003D14C43F